jgi:hypothetical protein
MKILDNSIFIVHYRSESEIEVTYEQALVGLEWFNKLIDESDDLGNGAEFFIREFPSLAMDAEEVESEVCGISGPMHLDE